MGWDGHGGSQMGVICIEMREMAGSGSGSGYHQEKSFWRGFVEGANS
jgi:hypothetical protein